MSNALLGRAIREAWHGICLDILNGSYDDDIICVQPLAERFRDTCGVDPAYVANFGEEVARGQPVFIMGQLLKCLEPTLRETAEVAPWQVQHLAASLWLTCKAVVWDRIQADQSCWANQETKWVQVPTHKSCTPLPDAALCMTCQSHDGL